MGLTLQIADFVSRTVRSSIGEDGLRVIQVAETKLAKDDNGNLLDTIWNALTNLPGILSTVWQKLTDFTQWSITAIWGKIVNTTQFILNFNWNQSDNTLDDNIKNSFKTLVPILGTITGTALGYAVCGAIPGAAVFVFNEPMGLHVLESVGEKALEKLAAESTSLMKQTFNVLQTASFNFLYKNIRTLWRESDDSMKHRLMKVGVKKADIEKALTDRNKPYVISQKINDKVNNIKNDVVKQFVQSALQSFGTSCIEAGYVVANSIDSYLATQKAANENILGEEKLIEIEFKDDGSTSIKEIKEAAKNQTK